MKYTAESLSQYGIFELRDIAREAGIASSYSYPKKKLIQKILETLAQKNNLNNNSTKATAVNTKELLNEIIEYLKKNYAIVGVAVSEQIDAYITSSIDFAVNFGDGPNAYKIILTDMQRIIIK